MIFGHSRKIPPVSFFAFQDIITGVAGMLLVMLLLLVCFTHFAAARQPEKTAAGAPGAARESRLRARLAAEDAALRAARANLDQLRMAAQAAARGEQAAREARTLAAAQREVSAAIAERKTELFELNGQLEALKKQLAAVPAATAEILALDGQIAERELALRNRAAMRKIRLSGNRRAVVLDCSRTRWLWARPDRPARELGDADAPTLGPALADLRRELRALDPEKHTLLIAARPSSGGFIDALAAAVREASPGLEIVVEPLESETLGGFAP